MAIPIIVIKDLKKKLKSRKKKKNDLSEKIPSQGEYWFQTLRIHS